MPNNRRTNWGQIASEMIRVQRHYELQALLRSLSEAIIRSREQPRLRPGDPMMFPGTGSVTAASPYIWNYAPTYNAGNDGRIVTTWQI